MVPIGTVPKNRDRFGHTGDNTKGQLGDVSVVNPGMVILFHNLLNGFMLN